MSEKSPDAENDKLDEATLAIAQMNGLNSHNSLNQYVFTQCTCTPVNVGSKNESGWEVIAIDRKAGFYLVWRYVDSVVKNILDIPANEFERLNASLIQSGISIEPDTDTRTVYAKTMELAST